MTWTARTPAPRTGDGGGLSRAVRTLAIQDSHNSEEDDMSDGPWKIFTIYVRGDRVLDLFWTPSHRGPQPVSEDWRRPRRYTGESTRVIGLISNNDPIDGWDLQIGELRTYPRELADELIRNNWATLAPELLANER